MDSPRRKFLFLASALAGAGTLVAVTVTREAPVPAAKPPADEALGYRVSEHILKYYETTRI